MMDAAEFTLGLIVRRPVYEGRSGRDTLDMALAAASLGVGLHLFFIGDGVAHLLAEREPGLTGLPGGHKAWAAISDLAPTRFYLEAARVAALEPLGASWLVDFAALDARDMPELQRQCDRILVL